MAGQNIRILCKQSDHLRSISDEVLVERAKAADGLAYAELCQRHSGMAMRVIDRILRNTEDTEDILQEAILKAYRQLKGFDGRSKFSTWFTKIAVNSSLMLLRKRKYRPTQSIQDFANGQGGEPYQFPDAAPSPESLVMQTQLSFQLRDAIQRLPPVLRDVTEIRRTNDFSVEEISGLTGLSLSATKSRLLRARKLLATRMVPRVRDQERLARG